MSARTARREPEWIMEIRHGESASLRKTLQGMTGKNCGTCAGLEYRPGDDGVSWPYCNLTGERVKREGKPNCLGWRG